MLLLLAQLSYLHNYMLDRTAIFVIIWLTCMLISICDVICLLVGFRIQQKYLFKYWKYGHVFLCNKFHLGLNSTRKLVWTDFMLDDFLPPTNLWNKLSLFLFITWGGRKTNDKWQKYLVWYDHHKLIATRIYFIWLCFAS